MKHTIKNKAKETKEILSVLARTYGITMLLNNMQGLLLKNQLSSQEIRTLQDTREQLYPIIRLNALNLVEAQGLSDNSLQSLIAPKDGDVYTNMYQQNNLIFLYIIYRCYPNNLKLQILYSIYSFLIKFYALI